MNTLLVTLLVAATITTLGGASVGFIGSRRVLRPLREVSSASAEIADGALSTRLDSRNDHDLDLLVTSFNHMAASLERRIEREARFASDVSHELRTPLTAMTNTMQLMRSRAADLPERMQSALSIFYAQVVYFEQLVLDLLEISRLDAGVERVHIAPADVEAIVRRAAAQASADPVFVIDPGLPDELPVDERRLVQVLTNLFDNAARYAGGVSAIEVAVMSGDLVIHVDDEGPGIPLDERSLVFERFHRGVSIATPGMRKGTGLGLALAREHVRLHGGSLTVTDAPAGGARFVISIPIAVP
jgi:signal transduction histidine kinase